VSITATAPAGTTGVADVRVSGAGGISAIVAGDHFTYGVPTVSSLLPASGPVAGGTTVTISGSGFAPGGSTVFRFGKAPALSVKCSSSILCSASAPASSAARAVDVKATVARRASRRNPAGDRFTYH
jgi:hypothetical protein